MRTGIRCTTLTQLPEVFCAGSTENSEPEFGAMLATTPFQRRPGYVSTATWTGSPAFTQVSSVSLGLASIQTSSVDTIPNAAVEAERYMPGCTVSTCVTMPPN